MKSQDPICVTQSFQVTPKVLWNALTELHHMHKWYFPNIPNFKPELGFETHLIFQKK